MATLFDDASLVMLPSGYKDDKLYSIKPIDGSGDFTFSRDGSGASPATRVNSAGLIEKGRTNLLLQSNQFDTTWTNTSSTETSGQSGYDGTNNAWKIDITATYGQIIQSVSVSGVSCASVYVKAGTLGFVRLRFDASTNAIADFDLSDGSAAYTYGIIDASSESIGNGWYRISMVSNVTSSTFRIYPLIAANDLTGSSGNIYIQNAQLEKGLVATNYIATTTAAASAGILGDMPRLDYSGGATCPSLLLEPSRTNLITQSEYFGSYAKVTSDATAVPVVTDNYATSPEGVNNAARVVLTKPGTDNDYAVIREAKTVTKTSGDKMAQSVYLKATDATQVGKVVDIYAYDGSYLTVTNHTLTSDWKRVEAIHTASTGTSNTEMVIGKARGWAGGTTLANMATDFLVYGHQFENGASYPTSYIPTHGSATARGEDVCINAGDSSTFNTSEGVLFGELKAFDSSISANRKIVLGDGSYNNGIEFGFQTTTNQMQFIIRSAGSISMNVTTTAYDVTDYVKFAISYKNNQGKVFINGSQLGSTDTSVTTPATISRLDLRFSTAFEFEGNVKQLLVFNTALTDAELQALTTL